MRMPLADIARMPLDSAATYVLYSEGGTHAAQGWFPPGAGVRTPFLRGGLYEWLEEVMNPRVASTTPQAERDSIRAITLWFGGRCRSWIRRARRRRACWMASFRHLTRRRSVIHKEDPETGVLRSLFGRRESGAADRNPLPVTALGTERRDAAWFATLREREFGRLDQSGEAYLDYTGSALYAESQVHDHLEFLSGTVLGNPHSQSVASLRSTEMIEDARRMTLDFFSADPGEYEVVFTANATGGMRLVGEAFPFRQGSRLVLSADNHNSVNGIREIARARGADVRYARLDDELRLDDEEGLLTRASAPSLYAFPAQSNFSGVQHPLGVIDAAQRAGYAVLLDAAAFVPTNPLRLDVVRPEFVALSFYKMFGYPTGLGA